MRNIRPIRTEADYDWALAEVARYFDHLPQPGTPEADRFDVLSSLIEAYEERHWPIDTPDPVEAIRAALDMRGLGQSGLAGILGSRSRASEILNRRRPLTLAMIQKLQEKLGLPADILVRPYRLAGERGEIRKAG